MASVRIMRTTIICLAILFSVIRPVEASSLNCLAKSEDNTLVWNSSWQSDRRDHNINYKVLEASDSIISGRRTISLKLSATVNAAIPFRYISIADEKTAASFCRRLYRDTAFGRESVMARQQLSGRAKTQSLLGTIKKSGKTAEKASTKQSANANLPFIRHTETGWVRSDYLPTDGQLTTCQVLSRRFSCLVQEKAAFGSEFSVIEKEAKAAPPGR